MTVMQVLPSNYWEESTTGEGGEDTSNKRYHVISHPSHVIGHVTTHPSHVIDHMI